MKRKIMIIFMSLLCSIVMFTISGCVNKTMTKDLNNYNIKLSNPYNGKEIDISEKIVRNYYRFKDQSERQALMLKEQLEKTTNERIFGDRQNITFAWDDTNVDETYAIHFSLDSNFQDELFVYETSNNYIDELGVFTPGLKYYYKVVGSVSGESMVDSFTVKNLPVRFISAGTILNMRDIGGYLTNDNKMVKYGMLYRGAALDGMENPTGEQYILERGTSRLDEFGLKVFNDFLKIKSEIDLRGVSGDQHETPAFNNDKSRLCQVEEAAISMVFQKPEDENVKRSIKAYFSFLADDSNYPIYFHCNGGADRTGALAFLINGLLGVSYDDLAFDYEITSFSFAAGGIRKRSDIGVDNNGDAYFMEPNDKDPAIGYCKKILIDNYGENKNDLQYAIENYLISVCGVTKEEISNIKRIMLEEI